MQIKEVDQHEDCVYSIAWSPAEAWMYCSLSYEGRSVTLKLNHDYSCAELLMLYPVIISL